MNHREFLGLSWPLPEKLRAGVTVPAAADWLKGIVEVRVQIKINYGLLRARFSRRIRGGLPVGVAAFAKGALSSTPMKALVLTWVLLSSRVNGRLSVFFLTQKFWGHLFFLVRKLRYTMCVFLSVVTAPNRFSQNTADFHYRGVFFFVAHDRPLTVFRSFFGVITCVTHVTPRRRRRRRATHPPHNNKLPVRATSFIQRWIKH